jgi:O-antigen/teichoic acid export membrane protein
MEQRSAPRAHFSEAVKDMVDTLNVSAEIRNGLHWRGLMAFAGAAGGFLTTALAARLLGRGEFTVFVLSASLIAIVPTLIRAGFGGSALINVTTAEGQGDTLGARNAGWSLFVGAVQVAPLVSLIASPAVLLARPTRPFVAVLLLATLLFAESLRLVASDLLLALHRQRVAALSGFQLRAALTVPVFGALVILAVPTRVVGLLGVMLIVSLPLTVLALRWLFAELGPRPLDLTPLRALIPSASPFVLIALANFAVARGDVWFAAVGLIPHQAATYGAASTLAAQLLLPLAIAGEAMAPAVSHLWTVGRVAELERTLRRWATITTVLSAAGGLMVLVAARPLLELIYGHGYGEAAVPFVILSAGAVISTGGGAVGRALAVCVGPAAAARVVAVGSALTVLLLGLGAWIGSPVALSVASSSGMVLTYGAQVLVVRRRIGIWSIPSLRSRRFRPGGSVIPSPGS